MATLISSDQLHTKSSAFRDLTFKVRELMNQADPHPNADYQLDNVWHTIIRSTKEERQENIQFGWQSLPGDDMVMRLWTATDINYNLLPNLTDVECTNLTRALEGGVLTVIYGRGYIRASSESQRIFEKVRRQCFEES
jgi:hypothetical protein